MMYTCQFCNKLLSTISALKMHTKYCRSNPNHVKKYPEWIYDLDDDGKLRSKYANKRNNAKQEGIEFDLSYIQFCQLVKLANLRSSDLGFSGKYYVLARYKDSGSYNKDNCRFITQIENAHERKLSSKAIESSRMNAYKMNHDPEILAYRAKRISELAKDPNSKLYKYREKCRNARIKHEQAYRSQLDLRFCGARNSQYGTYWITNGKTNLKWRDDKGDLPDGFYKGRCL